jgi:hypothetical protein
MQGNGDIQLPPIPGDLGLNRPTRAGLESFRELIMAIRQAATHDTPAAALSRAIAQVPLCKGQETYHALSSCCVAPASAVRGSNRIFAIA